MHKDILFIHQNMPAQFKHLAAHFGQGSAHRPVFLTQRHGSEIPGVRRVTYKGGAGPTKGAHRYVQPLEAQIRNGQQVARACLALRGQGFEPRLVVAHPGWGEALFLRDVYPDAAIVGYAEFYYSAHGQDIGFRPEEAPTIDTICRTRIRNTHLLLSLEAADAGISPTEWQRSRHPEFLKEKIRTIFDGIDVSGIASGQTGRFVLPDGRVLTRNDKVLTYVARNLEPYRGFPEFMLALPALLERHRDLEVVILGGDAISYGSPPSEGGTWRQHMLDRVSLGPKELQRLHFLGRIPYGDYLQLLSVSSVHLYLTYPFVLSWSCLEAMASGCLIVASDTSPVREVIEDGRNGLLVPFLDHDAISRRIADALEMGRAADCVRRSARETILGHYSLDHCLPKQISFLNDVSGGLLASSWQARG